MTAAPTSTRGPSKWRTRFATVTQAGCPPVEAALSLRPAHDEGSDSGRSVGLVDRHGDAMGVLLGDRVLLLLRVGRRGRLVPTRPQERGCEAVTVDLATVCGLPGDGDEVRGTGAVFLDAEGLTVSVD